jgi:hypothetical protein
MRVVCLSLISDTRAGGKREIRGGSWALGGRISDVKNGKGRHEQRTVPYVPDKIHSQLRLLNTKYK